MLVILLPFEASILRPVPFLQDRREIGGQVIQLLAAFVELLVFKEWTCKHLQGVDRVSDIGTVGKVFNNRVSVPYAELP